MPSMLIFLDFDGVLHPTSREHGLFSCMPAFESFIREHPQARIVISSSWRIDYDIDQLRANFSLDIAARIIGVTPDFAVPGWPMDYRHLREKEILAWLRDNPVVYDRWIALDDVDWMFSSDCQQLLLVDGQTGFDQVTAEKLRLKVRE